MALVTLKEILKEANELHYALPAFDTIDHVSAEAVVEAAEAQNRPVILMFPEAAFSAANVDTFFPFLCGLAERAKVPVALHLDHGQTLEAIMKAIHHGFSSVMVDGSSLPLEENIALTKKVVEIAHAAGVSVEAEIGHVAGGEGKFEGSEVDENLYTRPEDAKAFCEATGVDALAVAIGTVHGVYKGVPKLDIPRLETIKRLVGIPLVLHGGSGVSDEEFAKAIQAGINKVNLFTEISMAAVKQSVEFANQNNNKLHFAALLGAGKKAVYDIASGYLERFGKKNP